jgi:hypothetical protein
MARYGEDGNRPAYIEDFVARVKNLRSKTTPPYYFKIGCVVRENILTHSCYFIVWLFHENDRHPLLNKWQIKYGKQLCPAFTLFTCERWMGDRFENLNQYNFELNIWAFQELKETANLNSESTNYYAHPIHETGGPKLPDACTKHCLLELWLESEAMLPDGNLGYLWNVAM